MPLPHKTITRIARLLRETLEVSEKTELILYHLNVSQRRTAIWSERIWHDPDEAAKSAWEAAKSYADTMGGAQRFAISAYDHGTDAPDHPVRTTNFVIDGAMASGAEEGTSEPPNAEGMISQLMRHNQEMFRQHNAAIGALTHHLAKTVEKQADQIDRLMNDRMSTVVVLEELMSKKHERDLANKIADADAGRKKEMFDKLMQLAPIAVNKIAGREIVRQKSTVLEATVMAFMETLKPTQLDALAASGMLTQQQLILFSTILEQVTKSMVDAKTKEEDRALAEKAARNELEEASSSSIPGNGTVS